MLCSTAQYAQQAQPHQQHCKLQQQSNMTQMLFALQY
jgi:hypothetical protein